MLNPFTFWDDGLPAICHDPDRYRLIRVPYGEKVAALYDQSSDRWRATWGELTRSALDPETLERHALGLATKTPIVIVAHSAWCQSEKDLWARYCNVMLEKIGDDRWTDDPLEIEASRILGAETKGKHRLCRFVVLGAINANVVKRGVDACVEAVRSTTKGAFSIPVGLSDGRRHLDAMWVNLADIEEHATELDIADDSLTFWHGALRRATEEWSEGAQRFEARLRARSLIFPDPTL